MQIENKILILRSQNVMLDSDLSQLYGVETRVLIQSIKRNIDRFPKDFMFQLTKTEFANLKSQSVTSSQWGGRRYPPYAFTEQGVAMLASVLKSKKAIRVNIEIVRSFVKLRQLLSDNEKLARKLVLLEKKYDSNFKIVFDAIRQLMQPPPSKTKKIGFE